MKEGQWWTAPADGDHGGLVMVTGRNDIGAFRANPRFNTRVEVTWTYPGGGMPDESDARLMEQVHDLLLAEFDRDPVAVMTGVFTGDGERTWVFYTLSTNIFGRKLNEILSPLPLLPLSIYCENDPQWEQYDEMASLEIR